jgi:hypothetical protein
VPDLLGVGVLQVRWQAAIVSGGPAATISPPRGIQKTAQLTGMKK